MKNDKIVKILNRLISEFGESPCDINSGLCGDFTDAAVRELQLNGIDAKPINLADVTRIDDAEPWHSWIIYNGRHYDAESPKGVDNWTELRIFKRNKKETAALIKRIKNQDNDGTFDVGDPDIRSNPQDFKLGTCQNEVLIEEIFGSVSEFARQVDENGDDFVYGGVKVVYNPKTDIHTFYEIVENPPSIYELKLGLQRAKAAGDSEAVAALSSEIRRLRGGR